MKPKKAREKLASEWLKKAEGDLKVASQIVAMGPHFFIFVLFHAQQATEKALKAFLVYHELTFKYVHDISTLGKHCAEIDPGLGKLAKEADILTKYAVSGRYPGEEHNPRMREMRHGLKIAEKVFNRVSENISN